MKKGEKKQPKDPKRAKELKDEDLDKAVGGAISLTTKSFDPQPEPPGVVAKKIILTNR